MMATYYNTEAGNHRNIFVKYTIFLFQSSNSQLTHSQGLWKCFFPLQCSLISLLIKNSISIIIFHCHVWHVCLTTSVEKTGVPWLKRMLVVANLAKQNHAKTWKMAETLANGYSSESTQ